MAKPAGAVPDRPRLLDQSEDRRADAVRPVRRRVCRALPPHRFPDSEILAAAAAAYNEAMRSLLVILPALFLHAQTALPPDLDALTKIRTRMLFNLRHQPNYTCVETIERSTRS